jgi:hypothetical protein
VFPEKNLSNTTPSDGLIPQQPNHSELEVRHDPMNQKTSVLGPYGSEIIPLHHGEKCSHPHKICGLRKVTFWLTLALVATIIVAIVGGSVGGTLLTRKGQTDEVERLDSVEYVETVKTHN